MHASRTFEIVVSNLVEIATLTYYLLVCDYVDGIFL